MFLHVFPCLLDLLMNAFVGGNKEGRWKTGPQARCCISKDFFCNIEMRLSWWMYTVGKILHPFIFLQ